MNNREDMKWGRPRFYSSEQQEKVKLLSSQGVSVRGISVVTGIPRSTIGRILKPEPGRAPLSNGVTQEQFDEMFVRQDGRCAICRQKNRLFVDHDHKTGKARGLLCSRCNLGIGHFRDSPFLLANAISYVVAPPAQPN